MKKKTDEIDKEKELVRLKMFEEIRAILLKSADPLDDETMAMNFWALLKSDDVEGLIDLLKLYVSTHGRRDLHARLSSMSKNPTLKTICKIVSECNIKQEKD